MTGRNGRGNLSHHPAGLPPLTYMKAHKITYELVDRLHVGRSARVSGDGIASVVSTWLAEFGVDSPLAEELARAARANNWPAVHAIGDRLSLEVMVAA
ncbi:hypothetical protein [Mycobacterium sp. RTGN4]|uniref:hypothetical protein n=1 Tax=unclassified Mycobacterium TaxID=2642494 RepID=UPI0039AFC4B0